MTRKQRHLLTRIIVAAVLFLAGSLLHLPELAEMAVFLVCYVVVGWDIVWKAITNILHAGQPQTGKGFFAPSLLVHQTEDQFSLAPCVRSADHALHIRAVHQFLQDAELLFGGRRHKILPPFRQNGQICDTPLDVLGIVDIGRCQLH